MIGTRSPTRTSRASGTHLTIPLRCSPPPPPLPLPRWPTRTPRWPCPVDPWAGARTPHPPSPLGRPPPIPLLRGPAAATGCPRLPPPPPLRRGRRRWWWRTQIWRLTNRSARRLLLRRRLRWSPWEKFWISVAVVLGIAGLVFGLIFLIKRSIPPPRTISVVKLQVALGGVAAAKSFQKDLNRIAERVQGSSRRWYKFILTETISSLHRHKDSCISTSLSVDVKDEYSWNGHFKKNSLEERSKFDEETLSNLEGVKRKKEYSTKMDGSKNEYIVLTILVATDGTMDFPKVITSAADLKIALTKLYSTPETDLEGVHVLWAPQDEDDILSKDRMQKDYPYLKPLSV